MLRARFSNGQEFIAQTKEELASKSSLPALVFSENGFIGFLNCKWEYEPGIGVVYKPTGQVFPRGDYEDYLHADNPQDLLQRRVEKLENEQYNDMIKIRKLEDKIEKIKEIIALIKETNEVGGQGSRKKVRELIMEVENL